MATFTARHTAYRGGTRVEDYAQLYSGQAVVAAGEWIDMKGATHASYEIKGITTGTVAFWGSNASSAPTTTDDTEDQYGINTSGATLVKTMTADGIFNVPSYLMPRWIRAEVTVATTIDLTVNLKRVRYEG